MDPTITVDFRAFRQRPEDQPLPKKNKRITVPEYLKKEIKLASLHPDIAKLISKDLTARSNLGKKRYGTFLQPHNGRDYLRDLKEELLDALQYAAQGKLENEDDHYTELAAIDFDILHLLGRVYIEEKRRTEHLKRSRAASTRRQKQAVRVSTNRVSKSSSNHKRTLRNELRGRGYTDAHDRRKVSKGKIPA